nr:hypothetical protein L203_00279 [Cryptococcus depauperatus CBS 7841]
MKCNNSTVKEINRINQRELELGVKGSWHDEYKDSAYIFVGGLPFDLTEGDLIAIFSQWGEILDVNLVRDKETGKSRGFGFLMYEDQRSTVLAVDNMNGTTIIGRTIRVDHTKNYRQQGTRNADGTYTEPDEPVYNAAPPILSDSGDSGSSVDSEAEDGDRNAGGIDEEDPMAKYLRAERAALRAEKKAKENNGKTKDKKRKHEGETKEEKRARKEAKRLKKEQKAQRLKQGSEKERDLKPEMSKMRDDRSEERRGESKERWARSPQYAKHREYKDFHSKADRDDWRQGRWELERDERGKQRGETHESEYSSRNREQDGDRRRQETERSDWQRSDNRYTDRDRDDRYRRDRDHGRY